jgi:ATP-dependent Clp protease ATP-binding subunit ClpA
MEQTPGRVNATKPTGTVSAMAKWEARRLWHAYLGPEHLLLGLLVHGDNLAARVLRAHGLDLATVRGESTGWSPREGSQLPRPATSRSCSTPRT